MERISIFIVMSPVRVDAGFYGGPANSIPCLAAPCIGQPGRAWRRNEIHPNPPRGRAPFAPGCARSPPVARAEQSPGPVRCARRVAAVRTSCWLLMMPPLRTGTLAGVRIRPGRHIPAERHELLVAQDILRPVHIPVQHLSILDAVLATTADRHDVIKGGCRWRKFAPRQGAPVLLPAKKPLNGPE